MKYVNPEAIIDHLSSEMRRALSDAVQEAIPDVDFDEHELFRAFKRAVGRKCGIRMQVPDNCVEE